MALFMTPQNYPGHREDTKKCGCSFSVIHLGVIWQHLVQQKYRPGQPGVEEQILSPEAEGGDSHFKAQSAILHLLFPAQYMPPVIKAA